MAVWTILDRKEREEISIKMTFEKRPKKITNLDMHIMGVSQWKATDSAKALRLDCDYYVLGAAKKGCMAQWTGITVTGSEVREMLCKLNE